MKPAVMIELLETAAEQLGIKVSYEPLHTTGLVDPARGGLRGGLCRVKGSYRVIIDRRASDEERVATLAAALASPAFYAATAELELARDVRDLLRAHARPRRAA